MTILRGQSDAVGGGDIPVHVDHTTNSLLVKLAPGTGGTSDALEATQLLVKTAVEGINTATGAVTESPMANTILARLKDILSLTVLAAGSAIIGKVGIDQTTPGTSDSVTVKSTGHSNTVTITRPATTPTYTAGQLIGDANGSAIFAFANMGKAGGEVMITSMELEVDVGTVPTGMAGFTVRLFNASPTAVADAAAWDIPVADRGKYLGKVALGTPIKEGSTLFIENDGINKQIKLVSTTLYVELQTGGGYLATTGAVKHLTIHTLDL